MKEKIKQKLNESPAMRWLVLFIVSGLMFATYWFQDFYSGLKPLLETQLGITSTQFSTMISFTTLANLFGMIIVGGIILDKWGIRLSTMVFGTVTALGGLISFLGANDILSSDPGTRLLIMTIGRIVFGIGLETTCVIISRTIVKWFKGYELALAMAINMGIGRLGSAIGTAISPEMGGGKVSAAVTFAATLIILGFILMLIYLIFDYKIDKQLKASKEKEEPFRLNDLKMLFTNKSFLLIAGLCVAFYSAVFPLMQYAPDLLINQYKFSYKIVQHTNDGLREEMRGPGVEAEKALKMQELITLREQQLSLQEQIKDQVVALKEQIGKVETSEYEKSLDEQGLAGFKAAADKLTQDNKTITGLKEKVEELENEFGGSSTFRNVMIFLILFLFGLSFPIIPSKLPNLTARMVARGIILVLFIGFIYSFKDIFAIWIVNGPKAAAFLPMGTILFTPIFGNMVDKKGKAASIMLLGASLLIFSHTIFAFIPSVFLCYIALFALGIAFSLVPAAMWPSVAKIVPERRLGTAYAAMFTIQNIGLFLFFKGIGTVLDWVNPKVVAHTQKLREIMEHINFSNYEISDTIEHMKKVGDISAYNYTIPISLFIACGVAAIFLALKLKKVSEAEGYGLELPSNQKA